MKTLSTDYSLKITNHSDRNLYLAHFGIQLKYYTTKEEVRTIKNFLVEWRISLGIKETMSEEEIIINLKFIAENYGHLTLEMLRQALKLSLTGKLNVKNELYGISFAPLYIGKILSAFETYCTDKMNAILKAQREEEERLANLPKIRSHDQKVIDCRRIILQYAQDVKSNEKYIIDFKHTTWKFLKRMNLIDTLQVDFELAKKNAQSLTEKEVSKGLFEKMVEGLAKNEKEDEKPQLLMKYGRYFVMKQWFDQITNIEAWIETFSDEEIYPPKVEIPTIIK